MPGFRERVAPRACTRGVARSVASFALSLGVATCGGDSRKSLSPPPAAATDPAPDASVRFDAGSGVPPGPITFEVPSRGGRVRVLAGDGLPITFDFPVSAAGAQVTLTPVSASAIGWPDEQFAEVIRMEPDGMQFEHPVHVQPASGDVIVLAFPSASGKRPPEALPLDVAGDGFLLAHFSTLVVVPEAHSCEGRSGWVVNAPTVSVLRCGDRGFPNYVTFRCAANAYCLEIDAQCCAAAKATACHLGDPQLSVSFQTAAPDARYPYCAERGGSDSAAGRGGAEGAPAVGGGGHGAQGSGGEQGGSMGGVGGEVVAGGAGGGGEASGGQGGEAAGSSGGSVVVAGGGGGGAGEPEDGSSGGKAEGGSGAAGAAGEGGGGAGAGSGGEPAGGSGGEGGDAASGGAGGTIEPAAGRGGEGLAGVEAESGGVGGNP